MSVWKTVRRVRTKQYWCVKTLPHKKSASEEHPPMIWHTFVRTQGLPELGVRSSHNKSSTDKGLDFCHRIHWSTTERTEALHSLSLATSHIVPPWLVLTVCDHGKRVALTDTPSRSKFVHYSTSSFMVMDSQDSPCMTLLHWARW